MIKGCGHNARSLGHSPEAVELVQRRPKVFGGRALQPHWLAAPGVQKLRRADVHAHTVDERSFNVPPARSVSSFERGKLQFSRPAIESVHCERQACRFEQGSNRMWKRRRRPALKNRETDDDLMRLETW